MRKPAIAPRRWTPPRKVKRGPAAKRELRVVKVPGYGTEDVLVDDFGRVITGLHDGRILRISGDGGAVEELANTGGRPLGIEFDARWNLVVCDSQKGLIHVDLTTGEVGSLVTEVGGQPILVCNNAAVARDGTIYFSDSSTRFTLDYWIADILEHSCTGRLFRRDPDGTVSEVASGLAFANGVALAPDESWVAVAETGRYCVQRIWLTGPKAGRREMYVDGLPGFPDNISTGSDGLIWVTIASPRDPTLDFALPRHPVVRKLIWRLPDALRPGAKRTVHVQAYDAAGRLVHDLEADAKDFHMVTGVREHNGQVWLGSLEDDSVAVMSTA